MQKFKFFTLAILAMLSVNFVWGADLEEGNTLFTENFRGGDGNAFSAHTYSSTYSSITWFSGNSGDASSISYGGSNVHFSSSTAANMDETNAWLNKSTTGYIEIDNIPLHNVTKFQAHWAQSAKVAVTFYYKFNGVADWTSGGTTTAQAAADATSNEITVPLGKTSVSIKLQRSSNTTNQRVDKICLVATEVSSSCTAPTITKDLSETEVTYTKGATATALSITATGTSVTYQWYSNTSKSTTGATTLTGQTLASYKPSTATTGTKYYYCVASSSTCTTTSKFAKITVNAPTCYVTFLNNGQPISGTGIDAQGRKQYHEGDQLGTLPTLTSAEACDATSNHFMGWYAGEQPIRTKQSTAPTMVTSSTPVNGDMTLRAVWAREQ